MTTCVCTRPADGYLCRLCIRDLSLDLDLIANWWPESLTTLAKLDAMPRNGRGSKVRTGSGVPYNATAVEVRDTVKNTVVTWLRDVAGDRTPDEVRTVPQACRWMSTYATMIGNLPQAPQVLDEIAYARRLLGRLIDRPPERIVVAHCDLCGKGLSEDPSALSAVCDDCEHVVVVQSQRQAKLLGVLDRSGTKEAAVLAVAHFCKRRISVKTINRWIRNRQLSQNGDGTVSIAAVIERVQMDAA